MGKTYETLADVRSFIEAQHVFFVATAPLSGDGLVNLSPKGGDSFRILGDRTVGYLDLTGSGVETIAHLRENGRICIMFCSFAGPPKIVRLHGRGEACLVGTPGFEALSDAFPDHPGARSIVRVDVERISDSCGYAVPLYDYVGDRDVLDRWTERKGPEGLLAYRAERNAVSLDGLPGLRQ
ncbi:MAG TPA: pyridoxamine 5'-phosphate oxidase family protein [Actinomycetota bacterium]|nr:pyridoxamine 5'-phosphate oxidase family protein [Actinomycetota bacterium]